MRKATDCIEKEISNNASLSQNQGITAGRQNLLSAIWGGRNTDVVSAMPNGDPPSLMLWGADDQMPVKRYNTAQGGVYGR